MLTVLHTESSGGWGGQENRVLQESIGLRKRGVRVLILCQPGSVLGEKALAEGFGVRTCRMRKSYDLPAINTILKIIKTEDVDLISSHSGRDSLLAGIAGRLSRRKPLIVRTRHLALPITSRITYSVLPHFVITVSEFVRQHLIDEGVNPARVCAIPTGVDLGRFNPSETRSSLREELKIGPDVPLIGTVGILRIKKGHRVLLDAIPLVLQQFPEARFVFAGGGPQKRNIEEKIRTMGLSQKVIMLGLRQDIPEILKAIDLFVLPTLQEALGTSFLEAMAMERPVIGTDVGGVREVIKNDVNGFLVNPDDPAALAQAVIKTLGDREQAQIMGMRGRMTVHEHFSVEGMCEKTYALYTALIKGKEQ